MTCACRIPGWRSPLVLVGVANLLFTHWIPQWYGQVHTLQLAGMATPLQTEVGKLTAIWAVQAALLLGILLVLASGFAAIRSRLAEGTRSAVAGSLLAAMNTASEYGFGAVIASLPGFRCWPTRSRAFPIRWSTKRSPSPCWPASPVPRRAA